MARIRLPLAVLLFLTLPLIAEAQDTSCTEGPSVSASIVGHDDWDSPLTINVTYRSQYLFTTWMGNRSGAIIGDSNGTLTGWVDDRCLAQPEVLTFEAYRCQTNYPAPAIFSLTIPPPDTKPQFLNVTTYQIGYGTSGSFDFRFPHSNYTEKGIRKTLMSGDQRKTVDQGYESIPQRGGGRGIGYYTDMGIVLVEGIGCTGKVTTLQFPILQGDRQCDDCREHCPPGCVGSPIHTMSGNMRYQDVDPLAGMTFLPLQRTYDSHSSHVGPFGRGWSSLFDAALFTYGGADGTLWVSVVDEEGNQTLFQQAGELFEQVYPADPARKGTLRREHDSTWIHRDYNGRIERLFAGEGLVAAYRDLTTGREIEIQRGPDGIPTRLVDSWGAWSFSTEITSGKITRLIRDGEDAAWTYVYDGERLVRVDSPEGVWRSYVHDPWYGGLNIVRDGSGKTIESHDYDLHNGKTSIQDTGDILEVTRLQPGRKAGEFVTRVRYATGRVELHYRREILGRWRTVEIDGGCPSCGGGTAVVAYDGAGNPLRAQSAGGFITENAYDGFGRLTRTAGPLVPAGCDPATSPTLCRQTPDSLAETLLEETEATNETRYEYNDLNWPEQATMTRTSSVAAPSEERAETLTLDPLSGQVLTRAVSGWTGDPLRRETLVTTTTLYDGVEVAAFDPGAGFASEWLTLPQPRGLVRAVDGSRTDVIDVTTSVHYPLHESVPSRLRGRLAAVRNAAGHVTRFEDYDIHGNAVRVVDPNGVARESSYDRISRLITSTLRGVDACDTAVDPLCATDIVTTQSYYGAAALKASTSADGVTLYDYDDRRRLLSVSRGPSQSDLRERIVYEYDPATGKKKSEITQARQGTSWVEKRRTTYSYDIFARLQTVTQPGGATTSYTYDADGRVKTVKDENHSSPNTTYSYDAAGRLDEVRQTLATAPGGFVTTHYGYDLHGNLTSVTDPNGNVTTYLYDDFGRILRQISPVSGMTQYEYDSGGQLVSTTDANGATTTRGYDVLGRVTSAASERGGDTESVSWIYDEGAFGLGRLHRMDDPTGSTTYSYERRGLLAGEEKSIDGALYVTRYGHDEEGNRDRMVYPSGRVVQYGFDYAGRPLSATLDGATLVSSASYLPFGSANEIVYGNGTRRATTYDARYRIDLHKLIGPAGTIASYDYGHDQAGNITSIADLVDPGYSRTFAYDDLHRLGTANSAALWGNGGYTYDAMGNMLTSSVGTPRSFSYFGTTPMLDAVTEAGATRAVSYDAAGNESVVGAEASAYTPRNHLRAGGELSYAYDGRGVRALTRRPLPLALVSLAIDPATLTGGTAAEGTIVLNAPAPPGGVIVLLAASASTIAVPEQVIIDEGAVSALFTIETSPVAAETSVQVTATFGATALETTVTIVPPLLEALSFTPESLYGGSTTEATITLSGITAAGGKTVPLDSSSALLSVPPAVTIDAGRSVATFTASAVPVEIETATVVTAGEEGERQTASVRILPPELEAFTVTPGTLVGGEPATAEAEINAPAAAGGATVVIGSGDEALVGGASLVVPEGDVRGSASLPTAAVAADTPVVVTATRNLTTLTSVVTLTPPPVTIDALSIEPASLVGSNDATATIVLTDLAPPAGLEVELFSDQPLVAIPAAVQFVPGQAQASVLIRTSLVSAATPVTLTATHGAVSKSAVLTLQPPAGNHVVALSASPAFVAGGLSSTGTVTLALPAADNGGSEVQLTSSDPALIVPAVVKVKRNQSTATFEIATNVVSEPRQVTLTAGYGGVVQRATVIVAPENAVMLASLTIAPARVIGGTPATGTLALTSPAPFGGAVVVVTAKRRTMVTMPASVTIPEGATTATFPIATEPVHGKRDRVVEIEASYNALTVTATLTVAPPIVATMTPKPVALCASLALQPCLTREALALGTALTVPTESRHSLYSPELQLIAETGYGVSSTKPIEYEYVWFGGQPLVQVDSAGVHYYFNDHLGAPLLQTDAAGAVVWRVERDPYGERYSTRVGADRDQPLGLPGQEYDAAADRQYNIFRWYRQGWSRYMQADPIGIGGGLNLYGYVGGNPLGNIDPLGLVTWTQNAPVYHADQQDVVFKKCGDWKAHGCTLMNLDINCKCKCESGSFKAKINLKMNLNVWVRNDDPAYTIPQIINEEIKHVRYWQVMFKWAFKRGEQLEAQSSPTAWQCDDACKAYKQATYKDFASDWVHDNNPHP